MRKYIVLPLILIIGAVFVSFRRKTAPKEVKNFAKDYNIRECDQHGCGYFGASRTHGTHKGIDPVAYKGDPVPAPFNCVVKRHGRTYPTDVKYTLIEIEGTGLFKGYTAKIMHVYPSAAVGTQVKQGDPIAEAEGIENVFPGITPHYHLEIYDPSGNLLNPEKYAK